MTKLLPFKSISHRDHPLFVSSLFHRSYCFYKLKLWRKVSFKNNYNDLLCGLEVSIECQIQINFYKTPCHIFLVIIILIFIFYLIIVFIMRSFDILDQSVHQLCKKYPRFV